LAVLKEKKILFTLKVILRSAIYNLPFGVNIFFKIGLSIKLNVCGLSGRFQKLFSTNE
jgi:hypothetical protein